MSRFNYEGHYVCECGKEFNHSQKFNGHKTQCKEHLIAVGKYDNREHLQSIFRSELSIKGARVKSQLYTERKKSNLDNWINEQHRCERCGKIMTEKFGSGRFCSRSCANTRNHSIETREKISISAANSAIDYHDSFNYNFKSGKYNGFFCRSSYELIYLVYCNINNINVAKVTEYFEYVNPIDNNIHRYIPDFYLPDIDCYVELKGNHPHFNFEQVVQKCISVQSEGHGLLYIDDNSIKEYADYVKNNLNIKDITTLYENV